MLNGAEQSFMSEAAIEMLKEVSRSLIFVPVTTRSIEQYLRISVFRDLHLPYALTSNGGVLLVDGRRYEEWEKTSAVRPCAESLYSGSDAIELALGILSAAPECTKTRLVDGIFAFSKSIDQGRTLSRLKESFGLNSAGVGSASAISYFDAAPAAAITVSAAATTAPAAADVDIVSVKSGVRIYCSNGKIYVFPREISKGVAVRRLMNVIFAQHHINAGGSALDPDMLINAGAINLYPSMSIGTGGSTLNPDMLINAGAINLYPSMSIGTGSSGLDPDMLISAGGSALDPDMLISAGDSSLDLDMLNIADIAIVPDTEMGKKLTSGVRLIHNGEEPYEVFVLQSVLNVLK
jgi:hydroxymethylpyrimidine pyrophosphatase-like HAD family hydrolase